MLRVLFTYRIGRVMEIEKMITKKEDLKMTYVDTDNAECVDLYIKTALSFGVEINGDAESAIANGYPTVYAMLGLDAIGGGRYPLYSTEYKKLTLSDLKPRTKAEFVKCEFNHAWEAVKAFGEGEKLYTKRSHKDFVLIDNAPDVLRFLYDLHRKVETEIDERQEFIDRMLEMLDFNEAYDGNKIVSDMYDNFGFRFKLVEK